MGADEREPTISALPLQEWLAKQGHGSKAALAKKLQIDHGRLTNWFRRGIPAAKVHVIALEMGLTYEQYLARAGALPNNALPSQGNLETVALLADFERLPDGLKAHIAYKTAALREMYETLPSLLQSSLKRRPDTTTYKEWEKSIEELMAKYRRDDEE